MNLIGGIFSKEEEKRLKEKQLKLSDVLVSVRDSLADLPKAISRLGQSSEQRTVGLELPSLMARTLVPEEVVKGFSNAVRELTVGLTSARKVMTHTVGIAPEQVKEVHTVGIAPEQVQKEGKPIGLGLVYGSDWSTRPGAGRERLPTLGAASLLPDRNKQKEIIGLINSRIAGITINGDEQAALGRMRSIEAQPGGKFSDEWMEANREYRGVVSELYDLRTLAKDVSLIGEREPFDVRSVTDGLGRVGAEIGPQVDMAEIYERQSNSDYQLLQKIDILIEVMRAQGTETVMDPLYG